MPDVDQTPIQRLLFRGDTREPPQIFRTGFMARDMDRAINHKLGMRSVHKIKAAWKPQYEAAGMPVSPGGKDKSVAFAEFRGAGDIESDTAVCVTPRLSVAVLFPPKEGPALDPGDTWVYAVYVERGYNTHAAQYASGLRAVRQELGARENVARSHAESVEAWKPGSMDDFARDGALWALYAQEMATKRVPAKHVVCAVKVRRTWNGDDFTAGARYKLLKMTYTQNRRCRLDASYIEAVRDFVQNEPGEGETPSRAGGFHATGTG